MTKLIEYFDETAEFTKEQAALLKKYSEETANTKSKKQLVFSTKPSSESLLKGFDRIVLGK
jgi:hypothetical protein